MLFCQPILIQCGFELLVYIGYTKPNIRHIKAIFPAVRRHPATIPLLDTTLMELLVHNLLILTIAAVVMVIVILTSAVLVPSLHKVAPDYLQLEENRISLKRNEQHEKKAVKAKTINGHLPSFGPI
ncbi:hypothetical protein DPMN_056841 [Dreissena polymorpha]|uniref:Uncharacterized protein n=1 Tax=Dreissena polymorpha TaxID=45954 RepID=A0A9D4HVG4_DREPO|nr:hypothetical protein DPMN_056841 [Dreissena polymorpha]